LRESVERSWSALEVALAGDTWWSRIKGSLKKKEDQVFSQQVRAFLDTAPLPELASKVQFREACVEELRAARKMGLLSQISDGGDEFARYIDPQALLAQETQVLESVAGVLQEHRFGNLAYFISLNARQGQSLLAVAARYFFRRAIEDDSRLFQGLAFSQLDTLQKHQTLAFEGMREALVAQKELLEGLLLGLQAQVAQTHEAVVGVGQQVGQTHEAILDVQAELARQGAQNRELYSTILDLKQKLDLMHREVRPSDGLSVRSDQELEVVREAIGQYRRLPQAARQQMPALLNAVGQLEVASGDFEAAQNDFAAVAQMVGDDEARGVAHHNAYRAALERRDWGSALRELAEAIRIDGRRYAPFPVGKYHPTRILGAGGFGVAFLCRHKQLDADVVVKTLVSDDLAREVDQLFTEAKALYQLDHPAIIRFLDCGYTFPQTRGRPYFVMNYFEGSTLEDHVKSNGPLAVEDLAVLAVQMAQGLLAAHDKGILHRDVKPANVLVKRERGAAGPAWQTKLIDFGLALSQKAMTQANTLRTSRTILSASIAGTMEYAAPEQMGKLPGVKVGTPADVFGWARTCCYGLFESSEPSFHDWQKLPRGWAELLGDCLQRHPDRRPSGMQQVLDRIETLRRMNAPSPPVPSRDSPVLSPVGKAAPVKPKTVIPVLSHSDPRQPLVASVVDVNPPPPVLPVVSETQYQAMKLHLGATMARSEWQAALALAEQLLAMKPLDPVMLQLRDNLLLRVGGRNEALPSRGNGLHARILDVLRSGQGQTGLHLAPGIPPKKLATAMLSCGVPAKESVLALIDCTVFGSASDALVFAATGLHYHNVGGNVPDPGFVAYREFPNIVFGTAWLNCVTLGGERYLNKAGSSIGRDRIIEWLNAIRKAVIEVGA
jgi:serine/threonine protein kinase